MTPRARRPPRPRSRSRWPATPSPVTLPAPPRSAPDPDVDTEVDELAAMKGSLADLTNDLQRLQAEYANYRKRVDRDRQLVASRPPTRR